MNSAIHTYTDGRDPIQHCIYNYIYCPSPSDLRGYPTNHWRTTTEHINGTLQHGTMVVRSTLHCMYRVNGHLYTELLSQVMLKPYGN